MKKLLLCLIVLLLNLNSYCKTNLKHILNIYISELTETNRGKIVINTLFFNNNDTSIADTILHANAGHDIRIPRDTGAIVLDGSASTGRIISYAWVLLTKVKAGDGICKIDNDSAVKTGTHIFPFIDGVKPYQYQLTVKDAAGDSSRDTVNVLVYHEGPLPPQAAKMIYDTLTAANYITVPNGAIGDLWIDGANENRVYGKNTDIYIDTLFKIKVRRGKKILINAGMYDHINLNFGYNAVIGDTITNVNGQVQFIAMRVNNFSGVITGKYVRGITGDSNFRGHDAGYEFSDTTYGFYGNNRWQSTQQPIFSIVGEFTRFIELSYISVGSGGFCGYWIKDPAAKFDWVINMHDCNIFDTYGEGVYAGLTSGEPAPHIKLLFHNNSSFRAGNEGFQFSKLAAGSRIYNNVIYMSATRFRSPFETDQSTGLQIGVCNGDISVYNNYVSGAGEQVLNIFTDYRKGDIIDTNSIKIYNNVFRSNSGHIGNFYKEIHPLNNVYLRITGNYFGGYNHFIGDSIYTVGNGSATNTNELLQCTLSAPSAMGIVMTGNFIDGTKSQLIANTKGIKFLDTAINHYGQIIYNTTANTGFDTSVYNPSGYGMWAGTYYNTVGDEFIPAKGCRQFYPVYIFKHDLIFWVGKCYTSVTDYNRQNMPTGMSNINWNLLTWIDLHGHLSFSPPDAPSVSRKSYWGSKNIGIVTASGN